MDYAIIELRDDAMKEKGIDDITPIQLDEPAPVLDRDLVYIFEYPEKNRGIYTSVSNCVKAGNKFMYCFIPHAVLCLYVCGNVIYKPWLQGISYLYTC